MKGYPKGNPFSLTSVSINFIIYIKSLYSHLLLFIMVNSKDILEKLNAFVDTLQLSEEDALRYMEPGKVVEYKRKEHFIRQGGPCLYVGAILEGDFRFTRCTSDGTKRVIGYNFKNEFLTDYPSFLNRQPANYSIEAASDSLVYLLSYEQVMTFFETNMETQRFGRHIAEMLLKKREKMLLSFYFETPEERYQMVMDKCKELNRQLNLREIASIIGVTPETVSHIRKKILLRDKS